jgi:tRNA G10  N-methylase Trm11
MNCGTFVQHEWKTLGWQPACDCAATGTIPGTVLDPFAGSGTTLAVAAEQGRNAIGCELNAEYIALAKKRIREARESVALFDGIA